MRGLLRDALPTTKLAVRRSREVRRSALCDWFPRRWRALAAGLALGVALAGCSVGEDAELPITGETLGLPQQHGELPSYRLGPGDRITIAVFGHPDLSGEFEIDGNGLIAYPLIGQVKAGDQTVEELQAIIADDLNRQFVVDPRVAIEVMNFRPFFILGQVNAPGSYPYISGLNVRQAVAIAGGFSRRARQDEVIIVRRDGSNEKRYRATPNAPVLPGDTIEAIRRLF